MSQRLITYSMDYNMFRSFYETFLNWMWLMKDDYIQLPKMDEKINHVERLYHHIGFPVAIGSVGCVHLRSIKEVTTGVYSTRKFAMHINERKKVNEIGLY
jgi:hypothetical protein